MLPSAVSVKGIEKRYGSSHALRGISFEVARGEIFGLLGPNGAGKTTALECILGLREPDAGSILVEGLAPAKAKNRVGALLQDASLQDKITPRQALELFGAFYSDTHPVGELLERFGLTGKADAAFATLSGGQRQRLFLALALVNRPAVLVLDEPTAGLDPQARRDLRELIREAGADGRTVLLSTHDLEEAAQLCDRIAILDTGRLVASGPPEELAASSVTPARVTVRTRPALARDAVESLPDATGIEDGDGGWVIETRAPNHLLAALIRRADQEGVELVEVELRRPSLEDVFLELTGRPWEGAP